MSGLLTVFVRYGEIKSTEAPQANEVIVKILASPINPSDINMVRSLYFSFLYLLIF